MKLFGANILLEKNKNRNMSFIKTSQGWDVWKLVMKILKNRWVSEGEILIV